MKILVVDDEPRHRRGMESLIRNLRPEDEVLVAKDGAGALELVRSDAPDAVLSDIRMPNLDGLSFLKILQDEGHRTKVVMISAYNLFEYAQTAIRHGAYDYILKPVEAEKVELVLRRIEEQLAAESMRHSETEALKQRLRLASSAYRNHLLLSWLNGSLTDVERKEIESAAWIQGGGIVAVSEFRIDADSRAPFDSAAWLRRLEQAWAEFGDANTILVEALQEGVCQAITLVRISRLTPERKAEIRRMAAALGAEWGGHGRLTHGIGPECASFWTEAPEAYQAAQTAGRYHFHPCWNGILFHDELFPADDPLVLDGEKLFAALQGKDAEEAVEMCRSAFDRLAAGGHADPKRIKEYAALTLIKVKSRIRDYVDRQVGSVITSAALNEVPACRTFTELMTVLEARLRDVHHAIRQLQSDKSERVVDECLRWIQENAKEELTLEKVAEQFYFNPSYFSTLIKSRTGRTFSDHVTEARMRRAKELIARNGMKIYEIAAECGYQDTKYFCRVFKKWNGMSPEAYKHAAYARKGREG